MPVLNRRQPSLDLRKHANAHNRADSRSSSDSTESSGDTFWQTKEKFESAQEEMDLPAGKLASLPSRQKMKNNLLLTTSAELHETYQSSEEEASPSLEDYASDNDDLLEETVSEPIADETYDPAELERQLETADSIIFSSAIATAMPLIPVGRPKLIQISNVAPIQKRKRPSAPSNLKCSHRRLSSVDEDFPFTVPKPIKASTPARKESTQLNPPETWLPAASESRVSLAEVLAMDDEELYFPTEHDNERLSPTPISYGEYDPYAIDPPRLARLDSSTAKAFSSSESNSRTLEQSYFPGPRKSSLAATPKPSTPGKTVLRGLTSTLKFAKKSGVGIGGVAGAGGMGVGMGLAGGSTAHLPQATTSPSSSMSSTSIVPSGNKNQSSRTRTTPSGKPKMVPRGAAERQRLPIIPPFPFEERVVS